MTLDEKALQLSTTNAPAIPRLGVQSYSYWNESQHGIYFLQGNDNGTGQPRFLHRARAPSFPTNLSTSLSWDPRLVHREVAAISDEVRGFNDPSLFGRGENNLGEAPGNYGSLFHFNPTVNLQRDPRWGRTDEAFGEDPFLVGELGVAYVRGFEGRTLGGRSPSRYLKAVSTLKHYALNNVETNRTGISSDTDEATIRDYYTAQFRRLIEDGRAAGVMSAYNAVNGTPAVAHSFLLNVLARRTWGLEGYVASDCGAVATTYRRPDVFVGPGGAIRLSGHDWAPPGWSTDHRGEAARWTRRADGVSVPGPAGGQAFALRAGTELNCAGASPPGQPGIGALTGEDNRPEHVREAIGAGILGEDVLTRALVRVFTLRMATGEFDPRGRVPYARIGREVLDALAHRRLTQEVAERSIVLLRNRSVGAARRPVLPADPARTERVVVLGDLGGRVVLGGYSGVPTEEVSAVDGLRTALAAVNPRARVLFDAAGTSTTATGPAVLGDATKAAIRDADLVLVVAGTDRAVNDEGTDRTTMAMPGNYDSLIEQVVAQGNPRVALHVQASGPVALGAARRGVPAIVFSGPNGQRQGAALAAVLLGRTNPSGRLSFTWYRGDSQLPDVQDYDITPSRTGGLGRTYQYFTGRPSYPFGHGLSYTRFTFTRPRIGRAAVPARGRVPVSVRVRNAGRRPGATVVQVYATARGPAVGRELPRRRLVAFRKTRVLRPGETQRIRLRVPAARLRLFDPRRGRDVVPARTYGFEIATSSARAVARRPVRVVGRLGRRVRHVTVRPEQVVLRRGQRIDLRGRNRWLRDTTGGRVTAAAERVVAAAREDQSFADLGRARVRYASNRPRVARVTRHGRVLAVGPGVATITVTVDGTAGTTTFLVR